MEAYLQACINFKQNNRARLFLIAEFTYNNARNASISHIHFELNCGYHPCVSYKEDIDPYSKSKLADDLVSELKELMAMYQENFQHAQDLQKSAHDKDTKPRSYIAGNRLWWNSKYIKTKQNCKMEAKFFGPFRVLHLVKKQAYKLELPKMWKTQNVFHVLLLEQDTTRKGRVDKNVTEFEAGDEEGYEVEWIRDSAVYAKKSEAGHLPCLYYLVSWKSYTKEKNIWEPASIGQHLWKLISTFHKNISRNYFWWIRVPWVDLIHQSRRSHIPSLRPDLIHHQFTTSTLR